MYSISDGSQELTKDNCKSLKSKIPQVGIFLIQPILGSGGPFHYRKKTTSQFQYSRKKISIDCGEGTNTVKKVWM